MKLIVILHNIRSCYNVGAILRTAEGFGAEQVVLSGYTSRVHDSSLLPHLRAKLDKEIHKTALGAEDMLDIKSAADIKTELHSLRQDGWQVLGLENNIPNQNVYTLGSVEFRDAISDRVVLLLGEEVAGIDPNLFSEIDLFAEILMCGQKESFNVSVAAGIAMFSLRNNVL